jgi:membrane protease YdiL (CAAX protease family)
MGELLQSLVVIAVWLGLIAFVLVMAVLHRRALRRHWRTGLLIGLICFALMLPSAVFSLQRLDMEGLARQTGVPLEFVRVMFWAAILLAVGLMVLRVGWLMLVYVVAAAEWELLRGDRFGGLGAGHSRWRELALPAAFGVGVALASVIAFELLGVRESRAIRTMQEMLHLGGAAPPALWLVPALPAMTAAALAEEVLFRGALLGALLRAISSTRAGGRLGVVVPVLVVSVVWGLMHVLNTDAPLIKGAQVFAIGVCLCELARRRSLDAAIAAHAALNVTAVLAAAAHQMLAA